MRIVILTFILSFLFLFSSFAQNQKIKGIITDSEKQPLIGVLIENKTTGNKEVSEADGSYTIGANIGNILTFAYLGMETKSVVVADEMIVNVTLTADDHSLNEIVVVAFGTQRKADLASSVSSYRDSQLGEKPIFSIEQAMQGKMSGVQISTSAGTPGASAVARIRGASSLSAGNNPLYVIDGIPMNSTTDYFGSYGSETLSAIADINPSDIVSVEVLKDASASVLYGARASNGVILITTKKGEYNENKIQFSSYFGVQNYAKKVKLTNSATWMQIQNEARTNYNADKNLLEGDKLYQNPIGDPSKLTFDTDWLEEISRSNAIIQNYQLGISLGSAKSRSYISGGYFSQDGLIKTNGYEKFNMRLNVDHQLRQYLKVGADIAITRMETSRVIGGNNIYSPWKNAFWARPDLPVQDTNGNYSKIFRNNPVQTLKETSNKTRKTRILGNVYAELNLWDGLKFKTRNGVDVSYLTDEAYDNSKSGSGASVKGKALDGRSWMRQMLTENILTYDKQFTNVNLNLLAGQSFQKNEMDFNYVEGSNFASTYLRYLVSAAQITDGTSSWSGSALLSFFGRARAIYDEKYIAEFSLRRDGSSKFSGSNRFGTFPSVALAWVANKEGFFPENNILTDTKMRMSYGLTGNQEGINDFASRSQLSDASYNDQPGFAITTKVNENLKWEKTAQFDIGLDIGFLNSRITLTMDYYHKKTTDLLMPRTLVSTSGFSTMTDNVGSLKNEGLEFAVLSHNTTGEFKWTTNFNVSLQRNKILSLSKDNNGEWITQSHGWLQIRQVGKPIGSFYLIKALGVYQNKEEIPLKLWNNGVRPGDMKYEDFNNDGIIDSNDRQVTDAPEPKLFGGFDNHFSYKNFDLSVSTYFALGGKIYAQWAAINPIDNLASITQDIADKRWHGEGTSNIVPRAIYGAQGAWNTQASTRFLENASFLKCKDITLGYTVPKSFSERYGITYLRMYAKVQNLFTITEYSGYDPEVQSASAAIAGFDQGTQPQPRSFLFGLNFTF